MSRASLARAAPLGYQVNYLARLLAHALREWIESLGVVSGSSSQLPFMAAPATIINNIESWATSR